MKKLLALAAMLAAGSAQAAYITTYIDDFDGTSHTVVSSGGATSSAVGTATPTGYARDLTVTSSGAFTYVNVNIGATGNYSHSQGDGITGTSTLHFDLGGVDLTSLGGSNNAFRLLLASVDLPAGIIGLDVDGVSVFTSGISDTADGHYFDFLFSDFLGVDFTNVMDISMIVDGSGVSSLDLSVAELGLVCSAARTGDVGLTREVSAG